MNRKDRRAATLGSGISGKEMAKTLTAMSTGTANMQSVNTEAIDQLLRPNGEIIPVSYKELEKFTWQEKRLWMHYNGVYQIITTELVKTLNTIIGNRKAVEIVAGTGVLGKALDIPCVDNYLQDRADMKAYYQMSGQPTIPYGKHVIKSDANEWVNKHKPEIVIASWLTERRKGGLSIGAIEGPDENAILNVADIYVLIGNENIHGTKEILSVPHSTISGPSLISRNANQELNRMWIFGDAGI